MGAIGRSCSVVNLDPANDHTNYPCALDIRSLAKLDEIMAEDKLGPNGGILYALEVLEHNFDWLEEGLKELGEDYVLFDCPGQVELYTHHNSLRNIFYKLQKLGYRVSLAPAPQSTTPSLTTSAAGSCSPVRLLLPYPAITIHLEPPSRPPSHAPDGHAPHKCPYQDRQDLVIRPPAI